MLLINDREDEFLANDEDVAALVSITRFHW